ncbi:MAG: cytochrome c-type biogenesis protein CcmH [Leptothrix ochracea]|uniref:cytochrome c-type biogenesis protein n=1 Tax=Leptothrix ochracea TaxID=735331 RepID=UPI0034E2F44D
MNGWVLMRRCSLVACLLAAWLGLMGSSAWAREAAPEAEDPVLEARMLRVTAELRCLVCQNQTVADSHAELAVDLRNQVRDMLRQGKSEADIIAYMTARYGDFVLYRPPFKATTALLWAGPAVLLLGGLFVLFTVLRRRSRMDASAFEAEPEETSSIKA